MPLAKKLVSQFIAWTDDGRGVVGADGRGQSNAGGSYRNGMTVSLYPSVLVNFQCSTKRHLVTIDTLHVWYGKTLDTPPYSTVEDGHYCNSIHAPRNVHHHDNPPICFRFFNVIKSQPVSARISSTLTYSPYSVR